MIDTDIFLVMQSFGDDNCKFLSRWGRILEVSGINVDSGSWIEFPVTTLDLKIELLDERSAGRPSRTAAILDFVSEVARENSELRKERDRLKQRLQAITKALECDDDMA